MLIDQETGKSKPYTADKCTICNSADHLIPSGDKKVVASICAGCWLLLNRGKEDELKKRIIWE